MKWRPLKDRSPTGLKGGLGRNWADLVDCNEVPVLQ